MNITQRILETLRKDSGRVCPSCNEFLTAPGNLRWDYCESCRRAVHVSCTENVDGSPYCAQCAEERRKEIALDAAMDALKAFAETMRPHIESLATLDRGGEFTAALALIQRSAADLCDRWEFPQCPNCKAYAPPVLFRYRGDDFQACQDCFGKREPAPVIKAAVEPQLCTCGHRHEDHHGNNGHCDYCQCEVSNALVEVPF